MKFTALPDYFQAYTTENPDGIEAVNHQHLQFVTHGSWSELSASIPQDTPNTKYKLLILARHGQGYHNAGVSRYGVARWDEYWSLLDGDEHGDWFDAKLTPLGQEQVQEIGSTILKPMCQEVGLPQIFYSSPMRRCLETFIESWSQVFDQENGEIPVHVVENLRETLGEHTCDKRVDHHVSVDEYQGAKIAQNKRLKLCYEENYPEKDSLWEADHRETDDETDTRTAVALTRILTEPYRYISVTCHSGVIKSVLRNLQHPPVNNLDTGGVVALVVKCDQL